jgi:hypothetical protein
VNRETLDGIVKRVLIKYADDLLLSIGRNAILGDMALSANWVLCHEDALALLRDDARRLEIVDRILKEMNP